MKKITRTLSVAFCVFLLFSISNKLFSQSWFQYDDCSSYGGSWTLGSVNGGIYPNGMQGTNAWKYGSGNTCSSAYMSINSYDGASYSCSYATDRSTDVYATRPFSTAGWENIKIQYDWAGVLESCCDYGQMGYATDGSSFIYGSTSLTGNGAWSTGQILDLSAVTAANNNSIFNVGIKFHNDASVGSGTLSIDNIYLLGTPITPAATFASTTYNCGYTQFSASNSAPTAQTWYWQTASDGTSTTYPTTTTFNATSTGTYYIRARAINSPNTWSVSSQAVSVTVYQSPTLVSVTKTDETSPCLNNGTITIDPNVAGYSPTTWEYTINAGAIWSSPPSSTDPYTFSGIPAGVYNNIYARYTIPSTSTYCATSPGSVTISETALTATVTPANASCFGGTNGSITVSGPSGGTGSGYQVSISPDPNLVGWQNITTSYTFNNLSAQGYTVNLRDASCTQSLGTSTVGGPAAVVAVTVNSSSSPTCNGSSNGSITLNTATGGSGTGYQYAKRLPYGSGTWSAWQTSTVFSGLPTGNYGFKAKDGNNCESTEISRNLTQPSAISATKGKVNPTCFGGSNGRIAINASGGTSPYQYSKDGGTTYFSGSNPYTFSGLPAGTYNIYVKDANACIYNASSTVLTNPTDISISSVSALPPVSCYGGSDGRITVTASGGSGNRQYSKNNGSTYQTSNIFTGLSAGTYNIMVKDDSACTKAYSGNPVTVTQYDLMTATVTSTDVTTCGGIYNGTISFSDENGGSGEYMYSIDGGASFDFPNSYSGLTPGTYNIAIQDLNTGCTRSLGSKIIQSDLVTVSVNTSSNLTCFNNSTGSVTLNPATRGSGTGYMYAMRLPAGTGTWGAWQSSNIFNGLAAGSYGFKAKDSEGCETSEVTRNVTQPSALAATLTPANATCFNGSDGSIIVHVTNGTGTSPYTYSKNGGTSYSSGSDPYTFSNLSGSVAGTAYNIYVKDANLCILNAGSATIYSPTDLVYSSVTPTWVTCNGGSDGTISISASGGTGSLHYSINNGSSYQTGNVFSGLAAGTYNVVIKDDNNCIKTYTGNPVTVSQYNLLNATVNSTDVICNGDNNGTITFSGASGGTGTWNYSITGGSSWQSSGSFIGLSPGTYSIVIRDATYPACTRSLGVKTIGFPAVVAITVNSSSNPLCFGSSDGTVTLNTATGGSLSGYMYSVRLPAGTGTWGAWQSSNIFSGLAVGSYGFKAKDANGCESSEITRNLIQPLALQATVTPVNALCYNGNSGSITVDVTDGTGTSPYTYSIDGGLNFSSGTDPYTFTNLTGTVVGTTYNVVVKDLHACTLNKGNYTLYSPTDIIISAAAPTWVTCNGGSNGTISISASGGTGSLNYSINSGSSYQTSNVFNGLTAGTYSVVVKDANNCTKHYSGNPVEVRQYDILYATVTPTAVICNGDINGTITFSGPSGGTGVWNYSISGGSSWQSSGSFTGLAPGTYSTAIQDATYPSCTRSLGIITVGFPDVVAITVNTSTNPLCYGTSDGSVTLNSATGGSLSGYMYAMRLPAGSGTWGTWQSGNIFSGLAIGSYGFKAKDGNGCESSEITRNLTQPAALDAAVTPANALCYNQNSGSITVDVTDGTGTSPYTFSLDGGSNYTSGSEPFTFSNLLGTVGGTTYNIVIKDAHACILNKGSYTLYSPTDIIISSVTPTWVTCHGGNDGTISISASGGTGSLHYSINNGSTFQTSNIFNGLTAGSYTIVVRDDNFCTKVYSSNPVVVMQYNLLDATVTPTAVICNGDNNGTITFSGASGGTGVWNYSINGGSTWQSSGSFAGLSPGTYNAAIKDVTYPLCTRSLGIITVGFPAVVAITVNTFVNPLCNGTSDGSVTLNIATGGSLSGYMYAKRLPAGSGSWSSWQSSNVFSGLAIGSYGFKAKDVNGCESSEITQNLTQPFSLGATVSTSAPPSCYNGDNGSIQIDATGGTSPYQYSIDGGATFATGSNPYIFNNLVGTLVGTNYDIVVRDAHSCVLNKGIYTLYGPTDITISSVPTTYVSCYGGNNGTITINASGGAGSFTYSIDGGTTYQTSNVFSGLTAGTYAVKVKDVNNCTKLYGGNPVTVSQYGLLGATVTSTNMLCNNVNNGTITFTNQSGGTGTYKYSINGGSSWQTSASFTGLTFGTYNVAIQDATFPACTQSLGSKVIDNPTTVSVTINTSVAIVCNGGTGSVTLNTATGGTGSSYMYASRVPATSGPWSSWQSSTVFSGLTVGSYGFKAKDVNGCESPTVGRNMNQPTVVAVTVSSSSNPVCNGSSDGSVTLNTATGGSGTGYMYAMRNPAGSGTYGSWQTSKVFSGLADGTYGFKAKDNRDCESAEATRVLTQPAAPVVNKTPANPLCHNDANGTISVNVTGTTSPYQFSINGGSSYVTGTNPYTYSGLSAGTYSIYIKDVNLCVLNTGISTLANPASVSISTVSTTHVTCSGVSDGSITVSASGGTGALHYSNNNGSTFQTSQVFTGLSTGTYSLVVKDDNNCTLAYSGNPVSVIQNAPMNATVNSSNITCNSYNNGTITFTGESGGSSSYNYSIDGGASWQTSGSYTGLTPGTYYTSMQDRSNSACTVSLGSKVITQPLVVSVSVNTFSNLTCNSSGNGSVTLNIATGGSGSGYMYASRLVSGSYGAWQTSNIFSGLAEGSYIFKAKDNVGCTSSEVSRALTQPDVVSVSVNSSSNPLSYGSSDGSITLNPATGGSLSGYMYALRRNSGSFGAWQTSNVFTGLPEGSYSLKAKDNNGCESSEVTRVLTQPAYLEASKTPVNPTCYGGANGSIAVNASGGISPYLYSKDAGLNYESGSNPYTFTGLSAGTYDIYVKDANAIVINTGNTVLTDPAEIIISNPVTTTKVTCDVVNDGTISVSASGGTGSLVYSNDGGVSYQTGNVFNGLPVGTYNIIVKDDNACTKPYINNPVSVTRYNPMNATVNSTDAVCNGNINGTITFSGVSGGSSAYYYSINGGSTWETSGSYTGLATGTYLVAMKDQNNSACILSLGSKVISEPLVVSASVNSSSNPLCNGSSDGSITLNSANGGSGNGYRYAYRPISGSYGTWQTSTVFSGLPEGSYLFKARDGNGCESSEISGSLTQPSELDALKTPTNPTCYGFSNGSISINASGGTPPYLYSDDGGSSFVSGSNPFTFTNLSATTYIIYIKDANNCELNAGTSNLSNPEGITISSVVPDTIHCFGASDGTITVNASGGTGILQYSKDNGSTYQTSNVFDGLSTGTYNIKVKDENSCSKSYANNPVSVLQNSELNASVNSANATCYHANDGTITFSNQTGGTGAWDYSIDGGSTWQTSASYLGVSPGTYYLKIQDHTYPACSASLGSVVVTEPEAIPAPTGSGTQSFCSINNPKISNILVAGTDIIWYNAETGGNVLSSTTALVTGTTYYATQTLLGCESYTRFAVAVTVADPSAPSGSASQSFCAVNNPKISDIQITGTDIIWYDAETNGNILSQTTALLNGTTYYASQTLAGCESDTRLSVSVTVTDAAAPSGSGNQSFCSINNPKISDILVTGTNIIWYDALTAGNVLPGTTSLVTGRTYYATQTLSGCESLERLPVIVTIADPSAPTGSPAQTFCLINHPKISDISISGTDIIWYDAETSGNMLSGTTALITGTTYYASQTISGCESDTRLAINVTVDDPAAPVGSASQTFCTINNPRVSDIVVTGTDLIWYDESTGGNTISSTTSLVTGTTYYASQTISGCESITRLAVTVTINDPAAPTGTASQSFCMVNHPTASSISVSGNNIKWYDAETSGNIVASSTALVTGRTYYASQTLSGCESDTRFAVTVTIADPPPPTGAASQSFCSINDPRVSNISVTGTDIIWYSLPSGGYPVPGAKILRTGVTYYASQTISGCESDERLSVTITVADPAAPTGSASQSFCSINNPKVSNIAVTGSNIIWYNASTGGNIVAETASLVTGTTYYASQTIAGCESMTRLAVTVTVQDPAAPTGSASQSFCSINDPKISNLLITGTDIKWYDQATAGSVLASTTSLVTGTTYYASQTVSGCESDERFAVTVTIIDPAAPSGAAYQSFCLINNPVISDIIVTGTNIIWYDASTGGNVLAGTTSLITGTSYYSTQTILGCESDTRLLVNVTIADPAAPTGAASQSFCSINNPKVSFISVSGTGIKWYNAPTGGSVVAGTVALISGTTYYASQTILGCESTARLAVTVTVADPAAPTGAASQSFCLINNPKVSDLVVTGTDINWYNSLSGGSRIPTTTALPSGSYYGFASQTIAGCESDTRFTVYITVSDPAAPTGSASQSFCSGASPKIADLTATGASIKWYAASSGGTALATTVALANGTHYYASQTVSGCESTARFDVTATIITTPGAPSGSASQAFCSGTSPVVANLSVSGTAIHWYSASSGGTPLATSVALVNGTHYYASQTVSGCESTSRFDVTATVYTTPGAPTGTASQSFCSGASPKVSNLAATGTSIQWYAASSGGTALATTVALANATHYYASQTVNGCESSARFDVTVTINTTPGAPTGTAAQSFCSGASPKVANLTASGTSIQWYAASSGGTALSTTVALVNGIHYYASQTVSGCESSARFDVTVTVLTTPGAPTGTASQTFCSGASPVVANLSATGTAIQWYAASSGGTALSTTVALVNGTHYYASQTVSGCESTSRFDVTATVNTTPGAPTGASYQSFCSGSSPKVANLVATGTAIKWYAASSGGTALSTTVALVNGTHYYASQTTTGCESTTRLNVTAVFEQVVGAAGAITGPVEFNPGTSGIAYSVSAITNATSYIWSYTGTGVTINGTGNSVTLDFSPTATSGQLKVKGHSACGNGAESSLSIVAIAGDKTLNISNVMLEGLYSYSGTMYQAYDESGPHWSDGSADHITVELHSSVAGNYSTIVYTANNVALSINGAASITVPAIYNGSYYIAIKHRNSLTTVSAVPKSFAGNTVSLSFASPSDVYGGNLTETFDGRYAIFGGEVYQDDLIDSWDAGLVDNLSAVAATGYLLEDVNGDGLVDSWDAGIIDNNSAQAIGAITPY